MRIIFNVLITVFIIAAIGLIVFYAQFELFPHEEELITSFSDSKQNRYNVVYIPGNATTNKVVQIREILEDDKYKIVHVLEGYSNFSLLKEPYNDSLTFIIWNNLKKPIEKDTITIYLKSVVTD